MPLLDSCRARAVAVAVSLCAALGLVAGCSARVEGPQTQTHDVGGVLIGVSVRTGLPQDSSTSTPGAQAGDNTLVVNLRDDRTGAPIGDADVAASAYKNFAGQEALLSGRSQGNGIYWVPLRLGVPKAYTIIVHVTRGSQTVTSPFQITAN